ncbi:hypothetical protein HUJ05_011095 [Dendroctonus ponderosae]|nr:hypothetical protein HUJ05_011095 [Dendroctonus ponderosae]
MGCARKTPRLSLFVVAGRVGERKSAIDRRQEEMVKPRRLQAPRQPVCKTKGKTLDEIQLILKGEERQKLLKVRNNNSGSYTLLT